MKIFFKIPQVPSSELSQLITSLNPFHPTGPFLPPKLKVKLKEMSKNCFAVRMEWVKIY